MPTASAQGMSTSEILKRRERHLLPSTMTYFEKPLQIVRGAMTEVWDETGRRYLDAFSAVVTISVGHCHPEVVERVVGQMKTLQHMTTLYLHPAIATYAEKLADRAKGANPELEVSFFTNSGTEANELAALLAKNATGAQEFLAVRHSFHGRTLMAMTLTGQSIWRHSLPYVFGVHHIPAGYTYRPPDGVAPEHLGSWAAEQVEEIIRYQTSGKIAALFAEPIQGFGGCITPPADYFPKIHAVVKKYGGLFIADEVQTGFGRTGDKFFGIEHWGVRPDVITMAKGIGNGVPLGGLITTRAVAESMRGKIHFNTYGGNPVSMVQGEAVLDVLAKHGYVAAAAARGDQLARGLRALAAKHPFLGEVRGRGLMLGVELVKDKKTKEPAARETLRFLEHAKNAGVLFGKGGMAGNTVRVKPPLCVTEEECEEILSVFDAALSQAEAEA